MLLYLFLCFIYISFNCQIYAQNKQCKYCKYFIPYKNNKISTLGLCRMFGTNVYNIVDKNGSQKMIYNFAQHCRDDENLCGKNATFYEENKRDSDIIDKNKTNNVSEKMSIMMEDEMKKIIKDYYNFLRTDNDW